MYWWWWWYGGVEGPNAVGSGAGKRREGKLSSTRLLRVALRCDVGERADSLRSDRWY